MWKWMDKHDSHFHLTPASLLATIQHMVACITDIKAWMAQNYLHVNDDKTEFFPIAPKSAHNLQTALKLPLVTPWRKQQNLWKT